MKTIRCFDEQVLRKRDYSPRDPAGWSIRHWGYVEELGGRALRVVTLDDGETVHNGFPDRDFEEQAP